MSNNNEGQSDVTSDKHIEVLDSITVSYGNQVVSKTPATPKTLSWIVNEIRSSSHIASLISQVRAIPERDKRQEVKRQMLPWFSFSTFKDGRRKNTNFIQTKHIIIDADHLNGKADSVRSLMLADGEIFFCFRSPSGDGLKVGFELLQPVTTEADYHTAFAYFRQLLESRYGIVADDDNDPARACFLSHDPEIHINVDRTLHDYVPIKILEKTVSNSSVLDAFSGSASPGRTHKASQLIGYLNRHGMEEKSASEIVLLWNQAKNTPPLDDKKIVTMVKDMYTRYADQSKVLPVQFLVRQNMYYKVQKDGKSFSERHITNFTISPKELLVLPDSDCLSCSVTSSNGYQYDNVLIENKDWQSKTRLLTAIGHQDCNFYGSDNDVQALCSFIQSNVPVRKKGTKVIGLHDHIWAVEGMNVSVSGVIADSSIVPYGRGADSFYHGIGYPSVSDSDYKQMITGLYDNILGINHHNTILPMLAWTFVSPMKQVILEHTGSFPLLFVHGGQGGGKTSSASVFMRLAGYKDPKPYSCNLKAFPLLKMLSSTNGVPVFLDEFKVSDMKEDEVDNIVRYMRKTYNSEYESKGRPDQTVEDYQLLAPLAVMGEWSITQPAIRERILMARFSDAVKKNKEMQQSFQKVWALRLEGFMPRYIQFCLGRDILKMYDGVYNEVMKNFGSIILAPRIVHNLTAMALGLELFREFGTSMNVNVPGYDVKKLLGNELKEITGSESGFVKSAVDQLLEELSIIALNGKIQKERDYKIFTPQKVGGSKFLAIQFKKIYPDFKVHARLTTYEGDRLDMESYMRLFDDCDYVKSKSLNVKYQTDSGVRQIRSLCINLDLARKAGLDLSGFQI